jgi:hypothetical protein
VSPNAWKTLSTGAADELVLAVDFSTSGRAQAAFSDLAPLLDPPATVWTTVPPSADDAVAPAAYTDWWLEGIRASGRRVRAVLGYCAGGVFAAAMAERIATWQEPPHLVLFDPELPNTRDLYRDFHTAGDSMSALLEPEELDDFHEAGRRVEQRSAGGDLAAVGPELAGIFTAALGTAAERLELDDDIRDELAGVFDSLVRYLTAAAGIDPRALWTAATAITSREPAQTVGREIRLAVAHDDLLRDPATARTLTELLAGDRTATAS